MTKQGLLPISAAAVNCIPMFSRLREIIRQALGNGEKTGFLISVPSVGNGLNNLEFALKEETILKRLLQKGIALWLALALAASMLPAGFATGESSSSSGSGPAQSAEEADDTNLPYEYELDEDGNATLTI